MSSRKRTQLRRQRKTSPAVGCARAGVALIMVMVLVAIATVLGLGYLVSSTVKMAGAANIVSAARAQCLAESGLYHGLWILRNKPQAMPNSEANALGPFYADNTSDTYRFYACQKQDQPGVYVITAIGQTGRLKRTASMTVLATDYARLVVSLQPYTYWRLSDSGPTADDEMGRICGYYTSGASSSAVGAIPGDSCAQFDGNDDRINLGQNVDIVGSACTIMAWVRADGWPKSKGAIVSKSDGGKANDVWWKLETEGGDNDKRLKFSLKIKKDTVEYRASGGIIPLGQWVFAAAVYDGSSIKLYKDGALVGSKSVTSGTINVRSDVETWIGSSPPKATDDPWRGLIDEVAIFNGALTESQIGALYQARSGTSSVLSWQE